MHRRFDPRRWSVWLSVVALCASLLSAQSSLPAACSFQTLTLQSFASGCNSGATGCCLLPAAPTSLSGSLDATNCRVELTVHQLEGCCGVRVLARVLVIGDQQVTIPVPQFGPSCTLWVLPVVVLVRGVGDTFAFTAPAGLPSLGFYVQAAALSTEPLLPQPIPTLSPAYAVRLQ